MKKLLAIVAVVAISGYLYSASSAGRDATIETKTYSCNGYQTQCNFNLNAVGDLFTDSQLGSNGLSLNYLGVIPKAREIKIANFNIGSKALYSFIPTKAYSSNPMDKSIVNKEIKILFVGSTKNGEFAVMTYRKLPGESKWMEMATTMIGQPQAIDLKVTLMPNGNAVFKQNGQTQAVTLGRVIPGVSR